MRMLRVKMGWTKHDQDVMREWDEKMMMKSNMIMKWEDVKKIACERGPEIKHLQFGLRPDQSLGRGCKLVTTVVAADLKNLNQEQGDKGQLKLNEL